MNPADLARLAPLVTSESFLGDLRSLLLIPDEEFGTVLDDLDSLPLAPIDKSPDIERILASRVKVPEWRQSFQNLLLGLQLLLEGDEAEETEAAQFTGFLSAQLTKRTSLTAPEIEALSLRLPRILSGRPAIRRLALVTRTVHSSVAELDEFSANLELRPIVDGPDFLGLFPVVNLKLSTSTKNGRDPKFVDAHISLKECMKLSRELEAFWIRYKATRESFTSTEIEFFETLDPEHFSPEEKGP